jgi:segregation and condensation protein B
MESNLAYTLEALLFAAGEPLSISYLARTSGKKTQDVERALDTLKERLTGGVTLVRAGTSVALAVAPGCEKFITDLLGDPEHREIGQAGLEVLSTLMYQGPATRAKIDYIRGVNSTSSIRTLLMRGLIERSEGRRGREIVYQPTVEALTHLGIRDASELPQVEELKTALQEFLKREEIKDLEQTKAYE